MLRKACFIIIILLCASLSARAMQSHVLTDTVSVKSTFEVIDTTRLSPASPVTTAPGIILADSISRRHGTYAENYWTKRLKAHDLSLDDPSVRWPRFIGFFVNVYNWFQRNLNYHDTTYVKGDGRLGKVILQSDNWADSYFLRSEELHSINMMSDPYANLGLYFKYSILSVGYSLDMSTIFTGDAPKHHKWNFGINCARFNIELNLWRNEGTYIRRFGNYHHGRLIKKYFDGLTFSAWDISSFYLFNSDRFSWGAAYAFDNNQLISQGSALLGFNIASYRVDFDFSKLPEDLRNFYHYPLESYRFRYHTYNLTGGYTFNWVINRHFVFNITGLPGVGISASSSDSTHGLDTLFSMCFRGMGGLLYTNKRFFFGAKASFTGHIFFSGNMDCFTNIQNYQASVGIKF